MTVEVSRRDFLKTAAAGAAVLIVGFDSRGVLAMAKEAMEINVRIHGLCLTVTFFV